MIVTMSNNTPAPTVWHSFRARDARALIKFLVDAFGFEETVVYGDGDRVDHAQLDWPEGGGIMFGSVRSDADTTGLAWAYVVTAQPDAVYERAKAAGAEIVMDLHDTDYGSRDFMARDPEGNHWSFGTSPGEPRTGA
jgi:uncharacterized glyoxalase superfamily protein PhnB